MKTYKISMYYDDYIKNHEQLKAIDLTTESNSIIFYTDKQTIDYLNLNNIQYNIEFSIKDKIKEILVFRKFIFITITLMIFCVYLNTYRVQDITFNIDTPVNETIKEKIQLSHKKVFFFDFTNVDYQELSKELRSEYSCYEWISVSKNYDVIEVEIIKTGLTNKYEDKVNGNIVASKDGIIDSYIVHNGDILIEKNQYVKKGDILISGSYYDKVVSAKGLILATTYEEKVYTVNKNIKEDKLSGVSKSFFRLNLFNNIINLNKEAFSNFQEDSNELFKIPFIFSLSKVNIYESKEVSYEYDLQSAKEYGFTKVEETFNYNKVYEEEEILNTLILTYKEYDDYYEITYLVKTLESIGVFEEIK